MDHRLWWKKMSSLGLPGATRFDNRILPPDAPSYPENSYPAQNSLMVERRAKLVVACRYILQIVKLGI